MAGERNIPQNLLTRIQHLRPAIAAKSAVVLRFFSFQSLTMAFNLLFGLAAVRWFTIDDYAKFVVLHGVINTSLVLMDLCLNGTLVPLIGQRVQNHRLIADYVASLRKLSIWVYAAIAVGVLVLYPYLVRNRGWSHATVFAMIFTILATTWVSRWAANYLPVLMILGDRDTWYRTGLINAGGQFFLLLICKWFHWIGVFQAVAINAILGTYIAVVLYRRARILLGKFGKPDRTKQLAILRLAAPNLPQTIFFALQGQLSLYAMTYFGRTKSVASIGALSRLGQLFTLFVVANGMLVEPYFAKLPLPKLKKNFVLALVIAGSISITVWLSAALFPDILLNVLGSKYSGMHYELRLAVGASAISFFSAMFWAINTARRFVYWWNVGLSIALISAVQLVFIWKLDLSLLETALWMNIATNCASLAANIAASMWGFARGPRLAETHNVISEEQVTFLEGL